MKSMGTAFFASGSFRSSNLKENSTTSIKTVNTGNFKVNIDLVAIKTAFIKEQTVGKLSIFLVSKGNPCIEGSKL